MIETFSGLPRKSSAIFGNLRKSLEIFGNFWKIFGNVRVTFGQVLENLRKSSESARKSLENCQKHCHQYVYIIKRTLHVMFSWQEQYFMSEILFLPQEHKILIFSPPCNILYLLYGEECFTGN